MEQSPARGRAPSATRLEPPCALVCLDGSLGVGSPVLAKDRATLENVRLECFFEGRYWDGASWASVAFIEIFSLSSISETVAPLDSNVFLLCSFFFPATILFPSSMK